MMRYLTILIMPMLMPSIPCFSMDDPTPRYILDQGRRPEGLEAFSNDDFSNDDLPYDFPMRSFKREKNPEDFSNDELPMRPFKRSTSFGFMREKNPEALFREDSSPKILKRNSFILKLEKKLESFSSDASSPKLKRYKREKSPEALFSGSSSPKPLKRNSSFLKREKKPESFSSGSSSPKTLKRNGSSKVKQGKKLKPFYVENEENFRRAIEYQDYEAVSLMVSKNSGLLTSNDPISPLALAIGTKNEKIIWELILHRADLNSINVIAWLRGPQVIRDIRSPLGLAYENQLWGIAEFMIDQGAYLLDEEEEKFRDVHNWCLENMKKREDQQVRENIEIQEKDHDVE